MMTLVILAASILGGWASMAQAGDAAAEKRQAEKARVEKVIRSSIEWAMTKNKDLSYSCFAHDSTLFWFSPDDAGTNRGFEDLKKTTEEVFMNPAFKAVGSEFNDLTVHLSRGGDVAWYSCRLNDRNTWNGQPANWEDVRWTGVLEKQDGKWVIVQMHFSYSVEAMKEAFKPKVPEGK
jgi:ketosteroid isomerase-like protein